MAKSKKAKRMQMFGHVEIAPTFERIARGEMVSVEVEMFDQRNMATMDLRATALDRFWRDQLLAPEGDLDLARIRYDAGTKFALLFEATGLRQRETGAYEPRHNVYQETTDHEDLCECSICKQLSSFQAYQNLIRMLQRSGLSVAMAVQNLCIFEFETVDRRELIRGLDALIKHWGLD